MKQTYTLQLTANKTKLYKLVKRYFPEVPSMRSTQFTKADRHRSYWINFYDFENGVHHHFFFSVCAGRPTLGHETIEYDEHLEPKTTWHVTVLTLEELDELGLLERKEV